MVGFEPTSEQEAVLAEARTVASQVASSAATWDEEESFPESALAALRASGLLGLTVPPTYGGRGLGTFEACLVLEELAAADRPRP